MFETAERNFELKKAEYERIVPDLRTKLLELQRATGNSDFSVVVLVNGVEGAGKGEVVNLLNEWLDTRYMQTHAFGEPTEEQAHRPRFWRYWMALPPKGRIGVIVGNWYTEPILKRAMGKSEPSDFDSELAHIRSFERMLVDDGTLLVKIWLHVSKDRQRRHFDELASNPDTKWRVTKRERKLAKRYDDFIPVSELAIRRTSTGDAPWLVVSGVDRRHRDITVARHVRDRIAKRLASRSERPEPKPEKKIVDPDTILDDLDLTKKVERSTYERRLSRRQGKLRRLSLCGERSGSSLIVLFEGWDAAGKGGAIRRMIHALDARHYRVIPVAAPTDEERAHHYLWRFWRHLPRRGRITIYDRSWYGRVLVERVEGFAREREWRRAYEEINEFESQLVAHGIVLVKFWLHISSEEQLRRFKEREQIPWKKHKITEEDYRNREKANQYEAAVSEMVSRTSTQHAPWTLVEAESKLHSRLKVLETVIRHMKRAT